MRDAAVHFGNKLVRRVGRVDDSARQPQSTLEVIGVDGFNVTIRVVQCRRLDTTHGQVADDDTVIRQTVRTDDVDIRYQRLHRRLLTRDDQIEQTLDATRHVISSG